MENANIAKMIKNRREGTFGSVPQAGKPDLTKVAAAPKKIAVDTKSLPQANTESSAQTEVGEAIAAPITKGFIAGMTADGRLSLEMLPDAPNYLELIALFEYTNTRKLDIIESLAGTGNAATRSHLLQLTKTVSALAQGLNGMFNELKDVQGTVNALSNTFIPNDGVNSSEDNFIDLDEASVAN